MHSTFRFLPLFALLIAPAGCATYTEQGALTGGLLGAGTGAVIGHAAGNTAAGAAIGAGVGALTGAAVGSDIDSDRARAQQSIQTQVATTIQDVVNMTHSNVQEPLIINYVRTRGLAAPLQGNQIVYMQQQGVSPNVIAAMQAQPVAVYGPPPAYYYPDGGYYYGGPGYVEPRVGFGVSVRGR
jgi:hypothetical protein